MVRPREAVGGSALLKAGVAGAGVFGGHHARKYAAVEGVQVAAIYDHALHHAERLGRPLGAAPFDDFDAFLQAVDVVTIATPADSHASLARRALAAGKPVYVEKPLATTAAEADALVRIADERGLVLACGHQERVVFAAMGLLDLPEPPERIEAVRRGTPSERNRDVSCVLDLMIHDLDLAAQLTSGDPVLVTAEGGYDEVWAEIAFEGGMIARFEASRIAPERSRTMSLSFEAGRVEVDFLAPSFSNGTAFALNPDFASTPAGGDPLGSSVGGFVAAVRGERPGPVVSGAEGALALSLALAVEAAAGLKAVV